MSHYTQYLNYHVTLLNEFKDHCEKEPPFNHTVIEDEEANTVFATLLMLCAMTEYDDHCNEQGQWLVSRIVSTYSHLMHHLPRDLLWFFGGDCLHFMPDEEIAFYQQLDELRFSAEQSGKPFDIKEAKHTLSTLN